MTLLTLKTTIEQNIANGNLILSGKNTGLANLGEFLEKIFDLPELSVSATNLNLDKKELVLKGKTDLFKPGILDVTVVFTPEDKVMHFHIKVSLPVDKALPVPGLPMSHIAFEYFGSNAENLTAFIGGHTTVLGKTKVAVRVALPALKDELYVSSSAKNILVPSFDELIQWIDPKNDSLNNFLPPGFGKIRGLSISNFGFLFVPSSKTVSVILLSIKADEIGIFPGKLSIEKFEFSLQIDNPFAGESKNRNVSGKLAGNFVISGKTIPVSLARNGLSGDWNFRMVNDSWDPGHNGLNLSELLKIFAGEGFELPDFMKAIETITLERLEATFNLGNRTVSQFSITITAGKWDIIPETLAIDDGGVSISVQHPADAAKPKLSARVWGAIAIGKNLKVMLAGSYDKELTLKGRIPEINIKNLLNEIFEEAIELPAFIPDVNLTGLEVSFTPSSGAMSLGGGIEIEWKLGTQSLTTALSIDTSFNIKAANKKDSLEFTVTLNAKGTDKKLIILEGLELEDIYAEFSRVKGKQWLAEGSATVWLFGREIKTGISYTSDKEEQVLEFSLAAGTPEEELVNFEDLALLYGSSIKVKLKQGENKLCKWELGAASRLKLLDAGTIGGELSLKSEKSVTAIVLTIEKSNFEISLLPGVISARLMSATLRFGMKSGKWAFEASSGLVFKGLPQFLYDQKIIPGELKTSLKIDGQSITFTLKEVTGLMEFVIPVIRFSPDGPAIDLDDLRKLGKPAIQLVDLELSLGKQSYLSASIGFRFPEKINNIFGVEDDRKPSVEIFETKQLFKLKFGIGYKNSRWGIFCVPDSSPFKEIELSDGILKLDFGDYGLIEVKVPEFSSSGASFSATAGFKVSQERPLRFPLLPFKKMLEQTALSGISKILPDSVPINGIEFFKGGELQVQPLIDFLRTVTTEERVLGPMESVLRQIAGHAKKLPERLTDYLNINSLDSFEGSISVSKAGGININIDVKDSPVKMLYPMLSAIPSLQGITLRGFSFGNVFGASLFSMKIDADFDNFDLPSLLAGLVLPEFGIVPPEKNFHQRLLVHNLFMLIAIVKAVPIPVPLFYDRLGIDVLGIEGTAFNANAAFNFQLPDPMGTLKMISSAKKFFTDKNAKLVNGPGGLLLEFKLYDCYLKLPPFLGGALLGVKGELFKLNAMDEIVTWLNLIKFFDPVEAMLAVKVIHRFGKEKVSFGPLTMEADWLFTSIKEFNDREYLQIAIPKEKKESYLELTGAQPEKGLVTFLKGKVEIAELAALNASFGLVVKKGAGMITHYRIEGFIKGLVYFHSKGTAALKMETNNAEFLISGETYLKVGELEVFKGDIYLKAKKDAFDISGDFSLLPKDSPVNVTGKIYGSLSNNGLTISGGITANLGVIVLTEVRAEIHYMNNNRKKGVWLSANFFGQLNTIDIEGTNNIDITAQLLTLGTTLNGKVILAGKQVQELKITARLFSFFDVHVFAKKDEAGATKNIFQVRSSVDLPFWVDGECVCHPDHFVLHSVHIVLFPLSPLQTTAFINGIFTKDKFHLYGNLQAPPFLKGIFGNCYIDMNSLGFTLTASFLGKRQLFLLKNEDGLVKLSFDFNFLPFQLNANLAIRTDQTGGNLELTGGIPGLFKLRIPDLSLGNTVSGRFYIDLFNNVNFAEGGIQSMPDGYFYINSKANFSLLGGLIEFTSTLQGQFTGSKFSLAGETTLTIKFFSIAKIDVAKVQAALTENGFYVRFGDWHVAIRKWRTTSRTFRDVVAKSGWDAANPPPCYMCATLGPVSRKIYLHAVRLDGRGELYCGHWNDYGNAEEHLLWPDDMMPWRPGSLEDTQEETFEGIEPMPLLTIAREYLFSDFSKRAESKTAETDEKRTELTLSECRLSLYRYPNEEEKGLMNSTLIFHETPDEVDLIKELKAEIEKSGSSKNRLVIFNSKNIDLVFNFDARTEKTTLTLTASNQTDFADVSTIIDFDNPQEAYHELALLV